MVKALTIHAKLLVLEIHKKLPKLFWKVTLEGRESGKYCAFFSVLDGWIMQQHNIFAPANDLLVFSLPSISSFLFYYSHNENISRFVGFVMLLTPSGIELP